MTENTTTATAWVDVDTKDGTPVIVLAMDLEVAHRVAGGLIAAADTLRVEDATTEDVQNVALLENVAEGIRARFISLVAIARGLKPARQS